ncbi:MAG TPA: hypothetical protein VFA59_04925, partial [Vicinamibacterales bacterium]|nr:hypothetical protein [Vicinamibacterales bacterium]
MSPAFRAILDRLNASDVIVHIAYDLQPPAGTAGRITLATVAGGVRYLRISISPKLRGCDLVAILGHELQHAVEI